MSAEIVNDRCYARIGLMGNPSDGFGGKTLSCLISNFAATVTIEPVEGHEVILTPHPIHDPLNFESLQGLRKIVSSVVCILSVHNTVGNYSKTRIAVNDAIIKQKLTAHAIRDTMVESD